METCLKDATDSLGAGGGKAGSGAAKRRGDSEKYRQLAARRKDCTCCGSGMTHRHLNHHDYTLAAIDDIIGNGRWDTWKRLRLAVLADPEIFRKVVKVCAANRDDPPSQRHSFWMNYARGISTLPDGRGGNLVAAPTPPRSPASRSSRPRSRPGG
jgi:hypothetical protein